MENNAISRIRKIKELDSVVETTNETKRYPSTNVISKNIKIKHKALFKYNVIYIKRPMQELLTF